MPTYWALDQEKPVSAWRAHQLSREKSRGARQRAVRERERIQEGFLESVAPEMSCIEGIDQRNSREKGISGSRNSPPRGSERAGPESFGECFIPRLLEDSPCVLSL